MSFSEFSGQEQFVRPYQGNAVQRFCAHLESIRSHEALRHRELPIIQSSGSGKTRLISEALKSHFGILFNVRSSNCTGLMVDASLLVVLTTDDSKWLPLCRQQRHSRCIKDHRQGSITSTWTWSAHLCHAEHAGECASRWIPKEHVLSCHLRSASRKACLQL